MQQEQSVKFNILKSQSGKSVVSAKELHEKLQITTRFNVWFPRMVDYGLFVEKQDFVRVSQKCDTLGGEQTTTDYAITIDMAKELCMIQRTDIGKKCREYFIDCEKQIQEQKALAIPSYQIEDPIERAKKWIEEQEQSQKALAQADETINAQKVLLQSANEQIGEQQKEITEMKPLAQYTQDVLQSTSTFTLTQVAKDLGFTTVHKFTDWACQRGILYYQSRQWLVCSKFAGKGYFATRTCRYIHNDNSIGTSISTVVTESGRAWLHSLIDSVRKTA